MQLTSVLPGTKGCWILNHGALCWLADENEDSRADGEPVIVLDGFNYREVGHNIVGGMIWGPDGWVYGRHGIQATSYVGKPGDSQVERTALNCAVWRFHPQSHRFEVLTNGTTNPWGLDYNEYGELFFSNNVTGHAWHVFPNANYKRMFGIGFNPHYYELIDQHADHYHWDHSMKWSDSRTGAGAHGELGGGHAHCGLMIYQGDNWPLRYRNKMFMCNVHGRRVNQDLPERHGSGYTIKHGEDFLFANQPWFRGVGLMYGPDGGVYLSDWTDLGECHDHDGVHRTSGRIYKITYGKPSSKAGIDLAKRSLEQLVELQLHKNDWYVRHARRLLIDRKVAGEDVSSAVKLLREMASNHQEVTRRLRAIWLLEAMGVLSQQEKMALLNSKEEHLRVWGVRLLSSSEAIDHAVAKKLIELTEHEDSAFVRLYLASSLAKISGADRWTLAGLLCSRPEDAADHNLPLLIWYGIESSVVESPELSLKVMQESKIPLIRKFLARRLMHENKAGSLVTVQLVEALNQANQKEADRLDILQGMTAATKGWRKTSASANWEKASLKLMASSSKPIQDLTRELSVVFGDGRALGELQKLVSNTQATPIERRNALEILISSQSEDLLPLLKKFVGDKILEDVAARGLARFDDPEIPRLLVRRFYRFRKETKLAALDTFCARKESALFLLQQIKKKSSSLVDAKLSASHARQIASFDDPQLTKILEEVWGTLGSTDAEKEKQIAKLKQKLTTEFLADADLGKGRALFAKTCANCHRLFDSGKNIGPNITGSNRDSLDYLLLNIVSPSSVVPNQYKISTLVLESGQVINGVIVTKTDKSLTVQTEKELMILDVESIEFIKPSAFSLMPNGLIDKFNDEQIRNLFGYLQSKQQVAMPTE